MSDSRIPEGLGPIRRRILEVALSKIGAREKPSGSNRGPEIDEFLPDWAKRSKRGPAWCAFFTGWVFHEATGTWLPGGRLGNCNALMVAAKRADQWRDKATDALLPGDAFVMDTDGAAGSKGHTGLILRVSADYGTINTVEGNTGNAVRLGVRSLSDPRILGAICTVPDDLCYHLEYGTIPGEDVARDGTR